MTALLAFLARGWLLIVRGPERGLAGGLERRLPTARPLPARLGCPRPPPRRRPHTPTASGWACRPGAGPAERRRALGWCGLGDGSRWRSPLRRAGFNSRARNS